MKLKNFFQNDMKTREQLIDKITVEKILRWLEKLEMLTSKATKVVHVKNLLVRQSDIVVEACEEAIKESPEWAFENLKKLKSK
jgi:hypothetical protein